MAWRDGDKVAKNDDKMAVKWHPDGAKGAQMAMEWRSDDAEIATMTLRCSCSCSSGAEKALRRHSDGNGTALR